MSINVYQSALLAGLGAGALALFIASLFMNDGRLPWAAPPLVDIKENPLQARVAYVHENTAMSCPVPPCDSSGFALKVTHENSSNATLLGYEICTTTSSCVQSEGLTYEIEFTKTGFRNTFSPEGWSNAIFLGQVQGWKAHDSVDIKLLIRPANTSGSFWVYLGESEILEFERI
jgi:hypothetical protein